MNRSFNSWFNREHRKSLKIQIKETTTKYSNEIMRAYTSPEISEYVIRKFHFTHNYLKFIDWYEYQGNENKTDMIRLHQLFKYLHDLLPKIFQQK